MATISVLSRTNRQGTFTSASAQVPGGLSRVEGVLNITAATMAAIDTQVSLRVFVSDDSGATWQFIGGGSWVGGPDDSKNGTTRLWGIQIDDAAQYVGMLARAELDVLNRISVGLNLVL